MNYLEKYFKENRGDSSLDRIFEQPRLRELVEAADEKGYLTKDIERFKDVFIKKIGDGTVHLQMVLSDSSLDRSFERVDQSGWKLKNYKKNPVILWAHNQQIPSIGRMEGIKVVEERLIGNPKFDPKEIDPFSFMIEEKLRLGSLNCGSVGFKAIKVEIVENARDGTRLIIKELELFEFSICNVPTLPSSAAIRKPPEKKGISETVASRLFSDLSMPTGLGNKFEDIFVRG